MKFLFSLLACLIILNFSFGQGTTVSGYVSGTWGMAGEPYYVVGQCTVVTGTSLTIQPGVRVIFRGDYGLIAQGILNAQGTVTDSILFTIDPDSTSEFVGIRLLDSGASNSIISYARIEGAFAQGDNPDYKGGGIYCQNNSPTISHTVIKNCRAEGFGGGIALFGGSPTVEYCTVYNDSARYSGGVHINANAIIRNNKIFDNESAQFGGGLGTTHSNANLVIENNLIYNNTSARGGGLSLTTAVISELWNNLVYANIATIEGGGVYVSSATDATLTNTVIWNNSATDNGDQISVNEGTLSIDYSNIMDGTGGTYTNLGTLNYGVNNTASNPNFNDAATADFHVEATSPLVDAGFNTGAPSDDFDDTDRPFDGDRILGATVDIGPYEYVNTPPDITSDPVLSVDEDQPYTYQVVVDDPDAGEDILYEMTTSHTFLGIDAGTGEITGTPDNDDVDTLNVTVRATDLNGEYDEQTYSLGVVQVNDAPVVSNIPGQGINEDETFTPISLDDYVSDDDHSHTQISWTASTTTNITVTITDRLATITVNDPEWDGNETVTFTAEDPDGATGSDDAMFTVTAINDAPIVTDIPDQGINEDESFSSISLDTYVSDDDNVDSVITWTASATTNITVTITDRVATITVNDPEWGGDETVTFTAEDPNEATDSNDATFTVTAINDAPVVSDIPDQGINEDESFSSISLDDYVSDDDNIDAQITWMASATTNIEITITDRVATITVLNPEWGGNETVTFTAEDPDGATDSADVLFTVTAVNDPPQITPISALSFNEDDSLVTAIAELYEYVSDPDHPDSLLIITVKENLNVITHVDSPNVVMKAPANWHGTDTLEVKVSDGEFADSVKVAVIVNSVNDVPFFVELPDTIRFYNDSDTTLSMGQFASDTDLPDDNLSWDFDASTTELEIDFNDSSKELTLSAPGYVGVVTLRCTVADDSSASVVDSFYIKVSQVTALEDITGIVPLQYSLDQNYPNPFNPLTHIQFGMKKAGDVKIEVYNLLGQKVITLYDGYKETGYHIVKFNASGFSSGLYFYRMETEEFTSIKKMILMK